MNAKIMRGSILVALVGLAGGRVGEADELPRGELDHLDDAPRGAAMDSFQTGGSGEANPPGSEARIDEARAAAAVVEPRMRDAVYHASAHLYTNYKDSPEQVTVLARRLKAMVLGDPSAPTCYAGPDGRAQLAVQTEITPAEFASRSLHDALGLLDMRLDALFAEGLAVHLLVPANLEIHGTWGGIDWPSLRWAHASPFVPYQPSAERGGAYDALVDRFVVPVIEHLVKTGRAQRLAVIHVMNEFGYPADTVSDTAASWGGAPSWRLKRAEALAYTAARTLEAARYAARGAVPVGIKLTNVAGPSTGWAPVAGADQLSYLLNDVMGPSGDVLGYDAYFHPGDRYDQANRARLARFLPRFAGGRLEIAEFGRICRGSPGRFLEGSRTTAEDITGAARSWSAARGLNVFAFNASGPEGGCYSWTDEREEPLAEASAEARGLWRLIQQQTGSSSPSVCAGHSLP